MTDIIVSFASGTRIGLIVRGKMSAEHHPDKLDQHADAILANGAPVGFYGEGNGNSANNSGIMMQGAVWDFIGLTQNRLAYVDLDTAVSQRVVSTVLLVTVTAAQAVSFTKSWAGMTLKPGHFNIVGGNCSTHASAAFIDAGLLGGGIPGLDTPDHLYDQIVATASAASLTSITGFIGFRQNDKGGYDMIVRPYVDTPQVNRPNPGRSDWLSTSRAA